MVMWWQLLIMLVVVVLITLTIRRYTVWAERKTYEEFMDSLIAYSDELKRMMVDAAREQGGKKK